MFRSVKNRLIAVCVLIVIGAIGAATLASYLSVSTLARRQAFDQLSGLGDAHAAAIARWIKTQKDVVSALAPAVDADSQTAMLGQALKSGGLDLAYVGMADKRMVSVPDRKRAEDYDPTARPWYKLAEVSEAAVLTAPYTAAGSKKLVVSFAYAVKAGGKTQAVVGTDVSLDDVIATLNSIKPTASGFAMLLDRSGKIIAHPDPALTLKPASDLSANLDEALLIRTEGTDLVSTEINGKTFFVKSVAVAGTNWRLVTAAERSEALAALRTLLVSAGSSLVALVLIAALIAGLAVRAMLKGLTRVRDAMDQIGSGEGDLTRRLDVMGKGEIADISRSFNTFIGKIEHVVAGVRHSSECVAVATRQMASGNADLSQRTEEQASSLEETASSMEELTSTVKQNAENARQANQLVAGASILAIKGGEVVGQVVHSMSSINDSSRKIADIIGVIDGIAFQTNILALNAAVEAARAGEQGRGFAVVALEVRTLAQRSAAAAKEIKSLITDSVGKVEDGSKLVDQAGQTMEEIVTSVKRVTDIMAEIAAASQEQTSGIEQVNQAITQMDQVTQQNAALVEEAAAAAESMQEQAQSLTKAMAIFKLSTVDELAPSAHESIVASQPTASVRVERRGANRAKNVARLPKAGSTPPAQPKAAKVANGADNWQEF